MMKPMVSSLLVNAAGWTLKSTAQASVLVLAVLFLQALTQRRLPPRWRFALWYLVLVRLLLPISPGSAFSIFNYARLPRLEKQAVFAHTSPRDPGGRNNRCP